MSNNYSPLLSIIVPIYNVEDYLDRCINSLINQELRDIEIILVNDGSPDNCPYMCEEYKKKDNRIKVIHKKNEGLGYARNTGIEIAKGKYIAFVDSDDYVKLDMYKELCTLAIRYNLDMVISGFNKKMNNGKIIKKEEVDDIKILSTKEEINQFALDMIGSLPSDNNDYKYEMSVWRGIYLNEIIKKNDIKFPSEREYISEDIVFHIDYFEKVKKLAVIPNTYYYYCENDSSLTKLYRADRFEKNKILYYYLLRKINEYGYCIKNCELYLDRFILSRARVAISQIVFSEKDKRKDTIRNLIKLIIDDELVTRILDRYPIYKLPFKQKIFYYLARFKLYLLIEVVTKINYNLKK